MTLELTTHITLPPMRPLQAELYRAMRRWNVWVCHRRFGKTVLTLEILLKCAFDNPLPAPRYAYVAPLYRQAKAIAWDYLKRFAAQLPGCTTNESELRLDLPNGARLQLLGADNPDSIRGIYLDGVVLDEFAQMHPRAWTQVVRPALSDRAGWAIKVGTPYGKNAFWEEYREAVRLQASGDPDYHAALYRASATGVLSAAELASAKQTMRSTHGGLAGDAHYNQEYECQWEAAIPGAYYAHEFAEVDRERRVTRVPYDPSYPVYTWWDIGIDDATSIWCVQFVGRQICVLRYHEDTGYGAPHYAEVVNAWAYDAHAHILPHDGATRDRGSGERYQTILQRTVRGRVEVAQRPSLSIGIANVRTMFPRLLFDEVACEQGLNALRAYHHKWDDERRIFQDHPDHDWASHAADALRTGAISLSMIDGLEKRRQRRPERTGMAQGAGAGSSQGWMV